MSGVWGWVFVGASTAIGGGLMYFYPRFVDQFDSKDYYSYAKESVKRNKPVAELLGEPIRFEKVSKHDPFNRLDMLDVQLKIRVRGHARKGDLMFWADRHNFYTDWILRRVELLLDGTDKRIIVWNYDHGDEEHHTLPVEELNRKRHETLKRFFKLREEAILGGKERMELDRLKFKMDEEVNTKIKGEYEFRKIPDFMSQIKQKRKEFADYKDDPLMEADTKSD